MTSRPVTPPDDQAGSVPAAVELHRLAVRLQAEGKRSEALRNATRALQMFEHGHGPSHPDVANVLMCRGDIHQDAGRLDEAEREFAPEGAGIRSRCGGGRQGGPGGASRRTEYDEAERLYREALGVFECSLGPDHYDVAVTLNNLAAIAHARGRADEAVGMYRQALLIKENRLGPDHPETALTLNNLAMSLAETGNNEEALRTCERALRILETTVGPEHPRTVVCRRNHRRLVQKNEAGRT